MTKFKSIPNQGTKKIGLPIIGDVEFENGITELSEEDFEKISKLNFGFKLISTAAPVKSNIENEDLEEETGEKITKESLMAMTTKAMKDFMAEAFELSENEVSELTKNKKKEEVADEILAKIDEVRSGE